MVMHKGNAPNVKAIMSGEINLLFGVASKFCAAGERVAAMQGLRGVENMTEKIRRVVTGHDPAGKAVVTRDGAPTNVRVRKASGGLISTLIWATDETPADISGSADRAAREGGVAPPPLGSVFRVVDFPPMDESVLQDHEAVTREMGLGHAGAPARHPLMHRTRSVDYAIVMCGEIDMLLDDSEVHLQAGDVVVQQGTNHAWVNRGTENCRIAFVLIDASEPADRGNPGKQGNY